jgi:hypothetical protein
MGELGRGGMATVYLADNRRHHRKVPVKANRPTSSGRSDGLVRSERESGGE